MLARMLSAALLDVRAIDEIAADSGETFRALFVVALVALASGVGAMGLGEAGMFSLLLGLSFGLISWVVWTLITFAMAATLLKIPGTGTAWLRLVRTTGFAQAPGVLRVFGLVPGIGPVVFFGVHLWQLAAMVVAVRQTFDYRSTWRPLAVVAVGSLLVAAAQAVLAAVM